MLPPEDTGISTGPGTEAAGACSLVDRYFGGCRAWPHGRNPCLRHRQD
jgi:hypothetical protein